MIKLWLIAALVAGAVSGYSSLGSFETSAYDEDPLPQEYKDELVKESEQEPVSDKEHEKEIQELIQAYAKKYPNFDKKFGELLYQTYAEAAVYKDQSFLDLPSELKERALTDVPKEDHKMYEAFIDDMIVLEDTYLDSQE